MRNHSHWSWCFTNVLPELERLHRITILSWTWAQETVTFGPACTTGRNPISKCKNKNQKIWIRARLVSTSLWSNSLAEAGGPHDLKALPSYRVSLREGWAMESLSLETAWWPWACEEIMKMCNIYTMDSAVKIN